MTPELLESLLQGARETDAVEFKAAISWNRDLFVKDILAMANVVDGGAIIVGVEDGTFARQGLSTEQLATYEPDVMRDQVEPFADPRVIFTFSVVADGNGLKFGVLEVAPFDDIPVICARDGRDVEAGTVYFRSRSRRPESARVKRSADMREIIESAVARRSRALRRIGFVP
jgi:predicted HTH transcriptional regulator